MLIVLTWGATAALTTLVGAGREVFGADCFGAEGFVVVRLDEDLVVFLVAIVYSLAVSTVQPVGTPFFPVTLQLALLFLTNVPVAATFLTQSVVYVLEGVVVNRALM